MFSIGDFIYNWALALFLCFKHQKHRFGIVFLSSGKEGRKQAACVHFLTGAPVYSDLALTSN